MVLRGQRGRSEGPRRQWCVPMQGGCRNVARASGRCALLSVCTDSVSGHIDLFAWLFTVVVC